MSMGNKINYALAVVDMQSAVADDEVYNIGAVKENIRELMSFCRKNGIEVVFVRHDDGIGSPLERGCCGWEICSGLEPIEGEKVFDKTVNSIFRDCGLREYLLSRGVSGVVITGLQTEYCIDASCKAGFEHGFDIIIPENTTSTKDNADFTGRQLDEFFTRTIWNGRYASVMPIEAVKELLSEQMR